jgi:hypothetical protein
VQINNLNGEPFVADDEYTLLHDRELDATESVLSNDIDPELDPLTATLVAGPVGQLDLRSDGTFSYVPPAGFTGSTTFVYAASDGFVSCTGTVTLNVMNDAPAADDDQFDVALNQQFTGTVAANDVDLDGDTLTFSLIAAPDSAREFELRPDGTFDYWPVGGFIGNDQFSYSVTDGIATDVAVVSLRVDGDYDIVIKFAAFIPKNLGQDIEWDSPPGAPFEDLRWIMQPDEGGPAPHWYFATDDRSLPGEDGTSRLASIAIVNTAELGSLSEDTNYFGTYTGMSHRAKRLANLFANTIESDQATPSADGDSGNLGAQQSWVSVAASAAYPFIAFSPSIDYQVTLELERLANGDTLVTFEGSHDTFPMYELLLNGQVAYESASLPPGTGPTIGNLTESTSFSGSYVVHPPVA